MGQTAELLTRIMADNAQFKAKMQESAVAVKQFHSETTSMLKEVGGALGVAFSVGAIVDTFKRVSEGIDSTVASAEKLSISVQSFQFLDYAAKMTHVSTETLDTSLRKLSLTLGKSPENFTKLGLSAEHLKSLSLDKAFLEVAAAIGKMKNPADQSAAAVKLFGRGGQEALNLIRSNLTELKKEFDDSHLGLSDEEIETFKKQDEAAKRLSATISHDLQKAFISIAPAIVVAGKALELFLTGGINGIKELSRGISEGATAFSQLTNNRGASELSRLSGNAPPTSGVDDATHADQIRRRRFAAEGVYNQVSPLNGPIIEVDKELKALAMSAIGTTAAFSALQTEGLTNFKKLLGIEDGGTLAKKYLAKHLNKGVEQDTSAEFDQQLNDIRDIIQGGGKAGFGGSLEQRIADLQSTAEDMGHLKFDSKGNAIETTNSGALAAVAEIKKANEGMAKSKDVNVTITVDKDGIMHAFQKDGAGYGWIKNAVNDHTASEASAVRS